MKHAGQSIVYVVLVLSSATLAGSASLLSPPSPLVSAAGRAVALADVDGDGRPELVVGTKSGFQLFTETGFSKELARVPLRSPVDALAVGDFDGDGRVDLAAATLGAAIITVVPGDGHGGWLAPREISLRGPLTAFASGDVNRVDLLQDIVVGVMGPEGPELDVYESYRGASAADPEVVRLPAVATRIVVGELNDKAGIDIAAACGRDVVIVAGMDRGLGSGTSRRAASITVVAHARPIVDLAVLPTWSASRLVLLDDEGRIASPGAQELAAPAVTPTVAKGAMLIGADFAGDGADQLALVAPQSGLLIVLQAGGTAASGWVVRSQVNIPKTVAAAIVARVNADALDDVVLATADGLHVASTLAATTFTVNSALDTNDGTCNAANCTLREAIAAANANAGTDTIQFALGTGTPSIALTSALPAVTGAANILGNTGGATRIELNGSGVATGDGLTVSGGSTIRAVVVRGFPGYGIYLSGSNNVVAGCYVGTDAAGGGSVAGNGLEGINDLGNGSLIGGTTAADRNVISHNGGGGIGSIGINPIIKGNYIGTDASGGVALGNAAFGIACNAGSGTIATIGGTTPTPGMSPGNVISGNGQDGIIVNSSDTGTALIAGNIIGLNAAGSARLANGWAGVGAQQAGLLTVGGTTEAHRNVISGQQDATSGRGVRVASAPSGDGVRIQGNFIGTDLTGTLRIGNGIGISIVGPYTHTQIGAPTTAPGHNGGNVVSGNQLDGIQVYNSGTIVDAFDTIEGNVIGLDATGSAVLGNASYGVEMAGLPGSTIGGATADSRNVVSDNSLGGIYLNGVTTRVTVAGNYVGTDALGVNRLGNGNSGVRVTNLQSSSADIVIGGDVATPGGAPGNVVSGNGFGSGSGILIDPTNAVRVAVRGNIVGLDATGSVRLPNNAGMSIQGGDVVVGGTTAAGRNVVSGNSGNGISAGSGVQIIGNYIGTDLTGMTAVRNDLYGVVAGAAQIGGNTSAPGTPPGNLISGNGTGSGPNGPAGVIVSGAATVRGNAIGVGATGELLPNRGIGIRVDTTGATIGGTAAGDGNVISGNLGWGLWLYQTAGVLGNFIGTLGDGARPRPNGAGGIRVTDAWATIGPDTPPPSGTCTAGCNVIHANTSAGIVVDLFASGVQNLGVRVGANSFAANGSVGIDLGGDGVTANDVNDSDSGPNDLLNFPVITSSSFDGASTNVTGTQLPSFNLGGVTIDLYGSADADPTGYGEGNRWLGSFTCPQATPCAFAISVPGPWPVLSATATDNFRHETSEFSAAWQDLDGDGVQDSADPDVDNDGVANAADNCPRVTNTGQEDADGDGHGDACDCAPGDAGAFAIAGDVSNLTVGADKATLSWSDVASTAGPVSTYAVMRGNLAFPVGFWPGETCLGSSIAATTITDGTIPTLRNGFFYLVRADNVCGKGAWGTQPIRLTSQCP